MSGRRQAAAVAIGVGAFAVSFAGMLGQLLAPAGAYLRAGVPATPGQSAAASLLAAEINSALVLGVGALICYRMPAHRIGWLLLGAGCASAGTEAVGGYVLLAFGSAGNALPAVDLVAWSYNLTGGLSFGLFIVILFMFPTGTAISQRWARGFAVVLAAWVALAALVLVTPGPLGNATAIKNPFGWDVVAPLSTAQRIAAYSLPAALALLVAAASIGVRYWRGSPVERLQLRWILATAAVILIVAPLAVLRERGIDDEALLIVNALTAMIPVAIGIAVLRYRLYAIDRLISRTIGWAILTTTLVGAFAALVLGLQAVLQPLTGGDRLAVAASTLAVVTLFAPLRRRVQSAVDRRFDRSRHDGQRLLAELGDRLRDEVDLGVIEADVLATVDAAVRASRVGVWLHRNPGAAA